MRCKYCEFPAIYSELRMCKNHFLRHYEKQVREYLARSHLNNTNILVGVSGGKDSAALAHILAKLASEFNYTITLFSIHLRIPEYSQPSIIAIEELAKQLTLPLIVWDLNDFPKQIPEFTGLNEKGEEKKPCSSCGTIKRYLLNKAAIEGEFDYVATGHNLDDEHYFVMKSLQTGDVAQLLRSEKRLPKKPDFKLAGRIKPLYTLTEKENMIYCLLNNLPVHNEECPFSKGNPQIRFKEQHTNRNEKTSVMSTIKELKKRIDKSKVDGENELVACASCGYFTTNTKTSCLYCKVMSSQ